LFRAVIEDRPFADEARPLLFRAALDNARYHVAVATVEPLTYEGLSATQQVQSGEQDEIDLNDEDRWYDRSGNNLARIPAKQRATIASGLGLAFEKLDEFQLAVNHLRSAYKLETDPAKKSVINTKVQSLRAVLRRRSANAARQPSVHEALEQDRIVHPRLVTRAAVVSTPKSVARKAVTR
jgi:hypothetical protein